MNWNDKRETVMRQKWKANDGHLSMDSKMSWKALKHENCDQFLMHFYPLNKLERKLYNDFAMIVFHRKEITISLINDDHLRIFFLQSTLNPIREIPTNGLTTHHWWVTEWSERSQYPSLFINNSVQTPSSSSPIGSIKNSTRDREKQQILYQIK